MGVLYARVGGAWVPIGSESPSNWNSALGVVALHTLTTGQLSVAPHQTAQDEGLTVTFTEVPGRRYKITLIVNPYVPGGANVVRYSLQRNGVKQRDWDTTQPALSTTGVFSLTLSHVVNSAVGGAATWKVQFSAVAANTQINSYADVVYIRQLVVEDLGPAVLVASPAPFTTPWSPFTPVLKAGGVVANFGAATPVGRFKVIDTVCHFVINYSFGSGASAGAGTFTLDLPVAVANAPAFASIGSGQIIQAGARINVECLLDSATTFSMYRAPNGVIQGNNPQVAVGDLGNVHGFYEIAAS